jgi:hypothetical protein
MEFFGLLFEREAVDLGAYGGLVKRVTRRRRSR